MVRLTDRPDMILDVYLGRKTTTQQPDANSFSLVPETQIKLELQIRGGIEYNSKIIFLISQQKSML